MTVTTVTSKPVGLTPTCQDDEPTIAGVVAALESAWADVRSRHPEIPAAVIIIASGSPAKANQPMRWGHFATGRWQHGTNQHPEVMVSGEGLKRTAPEVFTTLLHEAAHGLAHARGIKDTSRQGRWHNKHFANLAAELGMTTTKDDKLGFSPCTLTEIAAARYRASIDAIGQALTLYRHPELIETKERTNNNNGVVAQCECPRKLRVSNAVFDAGPIRCDLCGEAFLPDEIDRDAFNTNVPNPHKTASTRDAHDTGDESDTGEPGNGESDDSEDPMVFYDPTGARYGLPTYPYKFAPDGLATVRQLRAKGLRPGGQDIAAQILWRRGKRKAYLYRIDLAAPKRPATAAQLAALARAMRARRTCPTCRQVKDYYIPRRYGECLDCAPTSIQGGIR
jgi:hypothetical protein